MPIYEYECENCKEIFEVFLGINDPPVETCPKCSSTDIKKLVSMQASVRESWDIIDAYDPDATIIVAEPKTIDAKRVSANRKYISFNVKKLSDGDTSSNLFKKIQIRITELVTANETFKQDQHDKLLKLGFLLQTTSE